MFVISAETGRTLFVFVALVLLLMLPLLRFRFHALVALYSVARLLCRIILFLTVNDGTRPIYYGLHTRFVLTLRFRHFLNGRFWGH